MKFNSNQTQQYSLALATEDVAAGHMKLEKNEIILASFKAMIKVGNIFILICCIYFKFLISNECFYL